MPPPSVSALTGARTLSSFYNARLAQEAEEQRAHMLQLLHGVEDVEHEDLDLAFEGSIRFALHRRESIRADIGVNPNALRALHGSQQPATEDASEPQSPAGLVANPSAPGARDEEAHMADLRAQIRLDQLITTALKKGHVNAAYVRETLGPLPPADALDELRRFLATLDPAIAEELRAEEEKARRERKNMLISKRQMQTRRKQLEMAEEQAAKAARRDEEKRRAAEEAGPSSSRGTSPPQSPAVAPGGRRATVYGGPQQQQRRGTVHQPALSGSRADAGRRKSTAFTETTSPVGGPSKTSPTFQDSLTRQPSDAAMLIRLQQRRKTREVGDRVIVAGEELRRMSQAGPDDGGAAQPQQPASLTSGGTNSSATVVDGETKAGGIRRASYARGRRRSSNKKVTMAAGGEEDAAAAKNSAAPPPQPTEAAPARWFFAQLVGGTSDDTGEGDGSRPSAHSQEMLSPMVADGVRHALLGHFAAHGTADAVTFYDTLVEDDAVTGAAAGSVAGPIRGFVDFSRCATEEGQSAPKDLVLRVGGWRFAVTGGGSRPIADAPATSASPSQPEPTGHSEGARPHGAENEADFHRLATDGGKKRQGDERSRRGKRLAPQAPSSGPLRHQAPTVAAPATARPHTHQQSRRPAPPPPEHASTARPSTHEFKRRTAEPKLCQPVFLLPEVPTRTFEPPPAMASLKSHIALRRPAPRQVSPGQTTPRGHHCACDGHARPCGSREGGGRPARASARFVNTRFKSFLPPECARAAGAVSPALGEAVGESLPRVGGRPGSHAQTARLPARGEVGSTSNMQLGPIPTPHGTGGALVVPEASETDGSPVTNLLLQRPLVPNPGLTVRPRPPRPGPPHPDAPDTVSAW